jgi:hypothetical protein
VPRDHTTDDDRCGTLLIETAKTTKIGAASLTEYYYVEERYPQQGVAGRQFWIRKTMAEKSKNGERTLDTEPVRSDEIYLVTVGSNFGCTCDGAKYSKTCKHYDSLLACVNAGDIAVNHNLRPEGGAE